MAKIVITIEKKGAIVCSAQRSSDIDRRTYLELLKKLKKGDFLDELEKLAKTIPVKERDTYEDNNRDRSN
jgi:hypothetical protein